MLGYRNLKHKLGLEINNVIIGHTGYIGSFLFYELRKKNNSLILGISRNKINSINQSYNSNLLEYHCDIFKNELNFDILSKRPTVYISGHNLQTNFFRKRESLENNYLKNIMEYRVLIKNLKKLNPKKVIFLSSSGSIYSNTNKSFPSHENSRLNPLSNYGLSKFILEKLLSNFSKEYYIPLTICRVSTIYGDSPSTKKFGFINYLINCAQTNTKPYLYGENTYRDYLHIKDLVKILIRISDLDLIDETYNISSGVSYTCLQIYRKVKQCLKERNIYLRQYEDKGLRLGENNKIFISSMKLKNEINWVPKITVDEGIKKIIMDIN